MTRGSLTFHNQKPQMNPTKISSFINPIEFISRAVAVRTEKGMKGLLDALPIADDQTYTYDPKTPDSGWTAGKFHWVPLGMDRGNAGRIKLATRPENPIAERTINAMESLIELERSREVAKDENAQMPLSPRDAVLRYYSLPALDQLPRLSKPIQGMKPREYARQIAKRIRVRVTYEKPAGEFAVVIEDDGIGQAPSRIHETLLSLGASDKGDKPYLIGLFGQGGSSTYAASKYSWCVSRRAPDLLHGEGDGMGWTVVKEIFRKGRRDPYYAYLAAAPSGAVPILPAAAADHIQLKHGSRFAHLNYNFAGGGSAVMRSLYYMLNHILYNPVLPFDLYAGATIATIYGNGYRLTNAALEKKAVLDKLFAAQPL